ncbi:MAG: hypothetical protein HOO06_10240 [Bdellovibrionaceae bacterium]|nr:hypothetical protein [Pseudobdellovibrionaceae bacterium]
MKTRYIFFKNLLSISLLTLLLVFYQNCGDGFEVSEELSLSYSEGGIQSKCISNHHIEGEDCVSNFLICEIENGLGERIWKGNLYGDCHPISCNSGFHSEGLLCFENTLICDSGFHEENKFCKKNVRNCSVDNGLGEQFWVNSAWSQCEILICIKGYTLDVHNNVCSQNIEDPMSCESGFHLENENCVSNTRSCNIANGDAEQTWQNITWGNCKAISCDNEYSIDEKTQLCFIETIFCDSGFHKENMNCISNTRSCNIANGSGQQTWANSTWGSCIAIRCDSGHQLTSGQCISEDLGNHMSYGPADISSYVKSTNLIRVPTSISVSAENDLSGVTFVHQLNQFISVRNSNQRVLIHDAQFNVINEYDIGTGPDTEDIVQLGFSSSGQLELMTSDEREFIFRGFIGPFNQSISDFKDQFNDNSHPERENAQEIKYRNYSTNNLGAEGIAYDPETGRAWVCLESSVIKTAKLPAYVKNQTVTDVNWVEPFDATLLPIDEIASCLFNPTTGHLLILSDEGGGAKIIEVNVNSGIVVSTLNISPGNSESTNYEGMTFNNQLDLILVSEPFHYQIYKTQ